jgi:hypothetical protein
MSTDLFMFLLVVVGTGAHLLAKAMPLPPGGVRQDDAQNHWLPETGDDASQDHDGWIRRVSRDDDDNTFESGVNIDGTPMMDDFLDIHGNAFGCTDDWMSWD